MEVRVKSEMENIDHRDNMLSSEAVLLLGNDASSCIEEITRNFGTSIDSSDTVHLLNVARVDDDRKFDVGWKERTLSNLQAEQGRKQQFGSNCQMLTAASDDDKGSAFATVLNAPEDSTMFQVLNRKGKSDVKFVADCYFTPDVSPFENNDVKFGHEKMFKVNMTEGGVNSAHLVSEEIYNSHVGVDKAKESKHMRKGNNGAKSFASEGICTEYVCVAGAKEHIMTEGIEKEENRAMHTSLRTNKNLKVKYTSEKDAVKCGVKNTCERPLPNRKHQEHLKQNKKKGHTIPCFSPGFSDIGDGQHCSRFLADRHLQHVNIIDQISSREAAKYVANFSPTEVTTFGNLNMHFVPSGTQTYISGDNFMQEMTGHPRHLRVRKPNQGNQLPCEDRDLVELLLETDNMFDTRPYVTKKRYICQQQGRDVHQPFSRKEDKKQKFRGMTHTRYFPDNGFQEGVCPPYLNSHMTEKDTNCCYCSTDMSPNAGEKLDDFEPPHTLRDVFWINLQYEPIGRFFMSSAMNTNTSDHHHYASFCHKLMDFMTFDDIISLDGLYEAVVSTTTHVEQALSDGFVCRFPSSCSLHLIVNAEDGVYPESLIACSSCPDFRIANTAGAVVTCANCRLVKLSTCSMLSLQCCFMLLRCPQFLRFVVLSSESGWESQFLFGWYHDFKIVEKARCNRKKHKVNHHFRDDLAQLLVSLKVDWSNLFKDIDFSSISTAVHLIHTRPGSSSSNDISKYGMQKLRQITRNIVWNSSKEKQCVYKTSRLGLRCLSMLNDIFPEEFRVDLETSVDHVKVGYPSAKWVKESTMDVESKKLLSTVKNLNAFSELPMIFLHDLPQDNTVFQNYNVILKYENYESGNKKRKYGWFFIGSQALESPSWGEEYPIYHKIMFKQYHLGIGIFPYFQKSASSKEVKVHAADLSQIPLPFNSLSMVHYCRDDVPYLVTPDRQNVFKHCVGIFKKVKYNYGFIRETDYLKGFLDPFPLMGCHEVGNVFLHSSSILSSKLPTDDSVIEFFCLNRISSNPYQFIWVCNIYSSIEEAMTQLLLKMDVLTASENSQLNLLKAKALELGIPWIDDLDEMEQKIEDYYNDKLSCLKSLKSFVPTDKEIAAISMDPIRIPSDKEWLSEHIRWKFNGKVPALIGPCDPVIMMANLQAVKHHFVKDLDELEKLNEQLEEEIKSYSDCSSTSRNEI